MDVTYDNAGRQSTMGGSSAQTGLPLAVSQTAYNARDLLMEFGGASLTYDANGNLTSDGTNTYTWNARNQLVAISGGASASFQYDPFGRRVGKTIGGTTQYLYDGANPVQELFGTTASANLLTGGVDEYFQRTDSAGARSYLSDALGSTLALTDSTGAIQTSYTFEPFGNTTLTGATTTNSYAYTGRELDSTGLYFYRARYYNASTQRFLSEDPIRFRSGQANFYSYVGNSPTNWVDRYGTDKAPAAPCIDANRVQRFVIDTLAPLSQLTGLTIGTGVGGSIGGGPPIPGFEPPFPGGYVGGSIGASRQLVVSPNGQAAISTSFNVGVAPGFGGYAGPQVSLSNAQTPADLGGPFVGGGYGGGDILGGGVDAQFGQGTNGQLVGQLTLTGGIAVGGKGSAGGGSYTRIEPICDQGHLWDW